MMLQPVLTFLGRIDAAVSQLGQRLEGKRMRYVPSIAGSILFILLCVVALLLMPNQINVQPDKSVDARTFPRSLLLIIMACSALILARDLYKVVKKQPVETAEIDLKTEIKAVILLLLLILYAVLVPLLGFIPSSIIYALLMTLFFRVRNWKYYIIAVAAAAAIGFIFQYLLHVRLP
jgi:hypothetical protein